MLASVNDRVKIMSMMEDVCKHDRMVRWVCNIVLRNINICKRLVAIPTNINQRERSVIEYWYADFIRELPYLRPTADKTQICSIVQLYNGRRITESVFKELDNYRSTYLPLEYQDPLKHYHNALNVILNDEIDSKLKTNIFKTLTDMSKLEEMFKRLFQVYRVKPHMTATLYYDDEDIMKSLNINLEDVPDTSQSIIDAALDFVVQFIVNAAARVWLVDKIKEFGVLDNDTFIRCIEEVLDISKSFNYITPTKKHNVIIGGGVIEYDTSTF